MAIENRFNQAEEVRCNAAELARSRNIPHQVSNGEELRYRRSDGQPSYIGTFTKGLPHDERTGLLLNPADFQPFVASIQIGSNENFRVTPLGPAMAPSQPGCTSQPKITCNIQCAGDENPRQAIWTSDLAMKGVGKDGCQGVDVRAWESSAAGNIFDLQGPDAQSVTMPPAPTLDSDELAAEMMELYLQALLRDTHFNQFRQKQPDERDATTKNQSNTSISVKTAQSILKKAQWFHADNSALLEAERRRHRNTGALDTQHIFRGATKGDNVGPYISQFLLIGNEGLDPKNTGGNLTDGLIRYGAIRIDQRVRVSPERKNFMTDFNTWLDVQNGADLQGLEGYDANPSYRFISTPRDLTTYVHHDALYQSYLNACLILLALEAPFDPGLPFQASDIADHQQGFASFGGPHILTLLPEVATRALKAVRFQKYNTHRRLRPEATAGLIDRCMNGVELEEVAPVIPLLNKLCKTDILDRIKKHNAIQDTPKNDLGKKPDAWFLPMAFPEGSPMHPSYGAGHASVAGACVTILKAFFDHGWRLKFTTENGSNVAYEASEDGSKLVEVRLHGEQLTVEGELNKLASNVSIGRNWAGVHYYSDYIESLRLGEEIAIGILEEQKLTYPENFSMTLPLFDGGVIRI